MQYKLVNPIIEGSFDTVFKAKKPIKAAHQCWLKLSKLLSNNVPSFAFTMKDMQNGGLFHYKVTEKVTGKDNDKKIGFTLEELDLKLNDKQMKRLQGLEEEVEEKNKQYGGLCSTQFLTTDHCGNYKSYYVDQLVPIKYWWYFPQVYQLDLIYMPSFIAPLTPYVTVLL